MEEERIIPSGPFKGKKIEFAPTTGVDMFWDIAEDFMQKVFDLEPGDYLITDESSLHDFTGFGVELEDLQRKIRELYDVDVSDLKSGNLLDIFTRIYHREYSAPS